MPLFAFDRLDRYALRLFIGPLVLVLAILLMAQLLERLLRLDVARPRLSSMMLADVIAGARVGTQALSYYRTVLYRSFTAPLAVFVMLLLALPTACSQPCGRAGSRDMLYGLGLGFLLCDGIVSALGTRGRFAPLTTALAAPLLFGAIGLLRLRLYERI